MTGKEILKKYKLKRTSCRQGILDVLIASDHALSENEIRDLLRGDYDRTTFYRSFKTLEESHILHKIVIDNQLVRYALDNAISHKSEHAHFYCNECQTVRCMDSVPVHTYSLPEGYSDLSTEVVIRGICAYCENQEYR